MNSENNMFNIENVRKNIIREMNDDMVAAAEPVIQKALIDIEMRMRKKLGEMIISKLEEDVDIMTMGRQLTISVRHKHENVRPNLTTGKRKVGL